MSKANVQTVGHQSIARGSIGKVLTDEQRKTARGYIVPRFLEWLIAGTPEGTAIADKLFDWNEEQDLLQTTAPQKIIIRPKAPLPRKKITLVVDYDNYGFCFINPLVNQLYEELAGSFVYDGKRLSADNDKLHLQEWVYGKVLQLVKYEGNYTPYNAGAVEYVMSIKPLILEEAQKQGINPLALAGVIADNFLDNHFRRMWEERIKSSSPEVIKASPYFGGIVDDIASLALKGAKGLKIKNTGKLNKSARRVIKGVEYSKKAYDLYKFILALAGEETNEFSTDLAALPVLGRTQLTWQDVVRYGSGPKSPETADEFKAVIDLGSSDEGTAAIRAIISRFRLDDASWIGLIESNQKDCLYYMAHALKMGQPEFQKLCSSVSGEYTLAMELRDIFSSGSFEAASEKIGLLWKSERGRRFFKGLSTLIPGMSAIWALDATARPIDMKYKHIYHGYILPPNVARGVISVRPPEGLFVHQWQKFERIIGQ